ncbi:hypothetical protein L0128_09060 [candidate division KSB1 bacterium]|nr:hypothetical protein [candidate division KSB1 bacterium]
MLDFSAIIVAAFAKKVLDQLLAFLGKDQAQLNQLYDAALEKTKVWYQGQYQDQYGPHGHRFYDYKTTEEELAKLLFLKAEPDAELIRQIPFDLHIKKRPPVKVIQAFISKFRANLSQIRACEAILVDKEKYKHLKAIEENTSVLPGMAQNLEKLTQHLFPGKECENKPIDPISWQDLYNLFTKVCRLDQLDYGHLGTQREQLEFKLELEKVYIALNVKHRSFDRLIKVAKVQNLTPQQQQNLPFLLQRLEELCRIEEARIQRNFTMDEELEPKDLQNIARQ